MSRVSFTSLSMKIWMGIIILLMAVTLWLVMTLSNAAPYVHVLPQVFSKDTMNFSQLVETTNMNMPDKELKRIKELYLIDEMLVRFYVEMRHGFVPDFSELTYRYGPNGPIRRLSTPAIYRKFAAQKGALDPQQLKEMQGQTTTADITRVTRRDDVFTVDFDLYQSRNGAVSFGGSRRATVKIKRMPSYRSFGSDFTNPFWVVVVSYDETALKKVH